jgi:acetyl esterase/lipase
MGEPAWGAAGRIPTEGRSAAQPGKPPAPGHRLHVRARRRSRPHQPHIRRPVRPAALIIQAGTHEVLLDDAVRLAHQAATADVEVTLDITPGVPHVFQAYYPILDEAAAALDRAGQFLSAHLTDAERASEYPGTVNDRSST